jgi:hypothetical protein
VRTRHCPEIHVRNMVSYQVAIDDRRRRILTSEPFHKLVLRRQLMESDGEIPESMCNMFIGFLSSSQIP